jgi:regulator of protease activity HflC (stomatin/prohibitin superfamily)
MSPLLLVTLLLCAATTLFLASVRRIPEGHAYTLRRVGGHMRTVGAGLHLVLPLIERVAHKIRLLNNVVEVTEPACNLRGRVYFQVLDAERADAVIDDMSELLRRRIPELANSTCTENDAAARNLHLKAELNRDFGERGVLITRVQLTAHN